MRYTNCSLSLVISLVSDLVIDYPVRDLTHPGPARGESSPSDSFPRKPHVSPGTTSSNALLDGFLIDDMKRPTRI